jgi:hypothetical protein
MARSRNGTVLTGVGLFADQASSSTPKLPTDALTRQVAAADSAAVDHARNRLARRLPARALAAADQYFAAPDVNTWPGEKRPDPGADLMLFTPGRSAPPVAAQPVIELPQFDRQYPRWAPFADDVAAVTGADVVLKLLVTDGAGRPDGEPPDSGEPKPESWRRDRTDVLITVIDGAERFAVASTEPPDAEPEPELDTVLRAGDTLRLPRAMLHTTRPDPAGSAMLSITLRRVTDWSLRRAKPSHLGFHDYPRSLQEYRLCLRSHVPPTSSTDWDPITSPLRTRIPGGLAVLGTRGPEVTVVAAGSVFRASRPLLRLLTCIHGADGILLAELVDLTGVSRAAARSVAESLLQAGLVRAERPVGS